MNHGLVYIVLGIALFLVESWWSVGVIAILYGIFIAWIVYKINKGEYDDGESSDW